MPLVNLFYDSDKRGSLFVKHPKQCRINRIKSTGNPSKDVGDSWLLSMWRDGFEHVALHERATAAAPGDGFSTETLEDGNHVLTILSRRKIH